MKSNYRHIFPFAALFLFLFSGVVQAQDLPAKWENFNYAGQVVNTADIQSLSLDNLKFIRGVIFGHHGRMFKEEDIQGYLLGRSWYQPDDKFRNSVLNNNERKNLDIIRAAEASKHDQVEPGDLRFYENRPFTTAMLGKHSLAELRIMRAEIEAIHGKRFDDEPWIQSYFEDRYWYAASKYEPSSLSEIERKNILTIGDAEKSQRGLKLFPGDMAAFQNQRVTEDLLHGLGLYELRILRNEIYALHGRQFKTPWIQNYFDSQTWYNSAPDFKDNQLSAVETDNVATIVKFEGTVHDGLSTKPVTDDLLQGLFLEDARKLRNEIFARHGRTFKDKWLQGYFNSFAWYKADPNFKDTSLTAVEKKNVGIILAYESTAESSMKRIEG